MKQTYKHTMRACYTGFVSQAIVNNLAPLLFIVFRQQYGISYEMLGTLILVNFGTQIVFDVLTLKFADRIGHRTVVVAAHGLCALGLVCLGVLPKLFPAPYLGLVVAAVLYAAGGGIIEVMISPIVNALPTDSKSSAMSLVHSFYCWGQMAVVLVTTLLLEIIGSGLWFVLPALWAMVPLYNLFRFLQVPLAPAAPEEQRTPLRKLLRDRFFAVALLLMLCAGSSELTMSQWSSLFAEQGLGVPKVVGDLLGPCLFAGFMGVGRALYGVRGEKIRLTQAMAASAALCVVCYAVAVFARVPALGLAGCALTGLSVSLMWPGTLSLSAEAFPAGGTAMFGALAVFGDIGASVGPWLTGWISELAQTSGTVLSHPLAAGLTADQVGLKAGLLAGIVFPALLLAGVLALARHRRRQGAT